MSRLRGAALLEDQEVWYAPATLGWGLPGDHSSKSSKGAPGDGRARCPDGAVICARLV